MYVANITFLCQSSHLLIYAVYTVVYIHVLVHSEENIKKNFFTKYQLGKCILYDGYKSFKTMLDKFMGSDSNLAKI